ncbi:hypothetical protein GIT86_01990 [Campylobacter upsaliensis]|nr:hypothetical protein [Campylobacter upsaliensis]
MKKHTQSPYESSKVSYKPSGIEWLGEIPQSWEIRRLKYLFYISKEESRDEFPNVLSLTQNGIIERDITTNKGQLAQNYIGYNIVKRGDIILNPMDLSSGYVAKSTFEGVISQAYIKIRPLETLNLSYYESFFQNLYHYKILWHLGKGISYDHRWTLGNDVFLNIKIPLPPLQEQKEIAEFLDSKCEKIQNYIDKKQKLITLLQEKKQALINEVVTKGLNPNIEFKNSGIAYLGLIPHHWEIKKLKYVGKVVLGKMLCNEHQKGYSHCYYLKSKNLQWLNVEVSQIEKMWFSEYEKSLYRIKKDDLLVSEGGEVGKTCIWNNELAECYIQNSVHKITLNKFNNAKFFLYLFFTYGKLGVFDSVVSRVSIAHLVLEKLVNVDMVVPPLQEQKQIANFLDEKCEKINSAIEKTKRQIELIKEYKNTLINEAVCGRIRVN